MVLESLRVGAGQVVNDLKVLKNIWLHPLAGEGADHAERLDQFYKNQADQYDGFRKNFLWGRRPMLAACAARLTDRDEPIWVDLGGGTAENIAMMEEFMPLEDFKEIYVVDLCHSLCEVAKKKVIEKGWKNVFVVEADATKFVLPEGKKATLCTFSYSLSMIPPFMGAIDAAISYLDDDGFLGVCDFYTSAKYDLPMRQHGYIRRWFWRAIFDQDNINLTPEIRNYLDHELDRSFEFNSHGSIPYVPWLRAPWYMWIGTKKQANNNVGAEVRAERPPLFPPTFLYNQSWEDPDRDVPVLQIKEGDRLLTLTSGGCNALDEALQGADVVSVDLNPAQSYLLELKLVAIKTLEYEDFWLLFGEGRHPDIKSIYLRKLAPFLSEGAARFWSKKLYYFNDGLYYHGGMGKVIKGAEIMAKVIGLSGKIKAMCEANTLAEQRRVWESMWPVAFWRRTPRVLSDMVERVVRLVLFNNVTLWYGGGIPKRQVDHILSDTHTLTDYAAKVFDGVALHSHLATENHFYLCCLQGHYTRKCCPKYLREDEFERLKAGVVDKVDNRTCWFADALTDGSYDKVILMDHMDWLDDKAIETLCEQLAEHVVPGGKIIWRSGALNPHYAEAIERHGFDIQVQDQHNFKRDTPAICIDKVNMYASFWVGTRRGGSQGGSKRVRK